MHQNALGCTLCWWSQQDCDGKWCVEKVRWYITEVDTHVGEDDDIFKQQDCCNDEEMVYMINKPQAQVSVFCKTNISTHTTWDVIIVLFYRRLYILSTGIFAIFVIKKLASLLG